MNKKYIENTRIQNLSEILEVIRFELRVTNRILCEIHYDNSSEDLNQANKDVSDYTELLKTEKLIESLLKKAGASPLKRPGLKSSGIKYKTLLKVGG